MVNFNNNAILQKSETVTLLIQYLHKLIQILN